MLKKILSILIILFTIFFAISFSKAEYIYEKIPYELALSKLMNESGIFLDSQNSQILETIESGYLYKNLSPLIKPFNLDSTVYKYYPFFEKAIDYEIIEYDTFGNKLSYKLIDDISSIDPKANITKDQFNKLLLVLSKVGIPNVKANIGNGLSSITINSDKGKSPFVANFKGDTSLSGGSYTYEWEFGNGSTAFGKNVSYVYVLPGSYEIKLLVTDKSGNIGISFEEIIVGGNNSCDIDTDGDLLNDCIDACPLVFGDKLNSGCPIFEISKPTTKNTGYECLYENKNSVIYGHYICNSCPCDNFLDFYAEVRKCDMLVPALISPDGTEMYSKGKKFQVKE